MNFSNFKQLIDYLKFCKLCKENSRSISLEKKGFNKITTYQDDNTIIYYFKNKIFMSIDLNSNNVKTEYFTGNEYHEINFIANCVTCNSSCKNLPFNLCEKNNGVELKIDHESFIFNDIKLINILQDPDHIFEFENIKVPFSLIIKGDKITFSDILSASKFDLIEVSNYNKEQLLNKIKTILVFQ
jgi:hypothetical protein